MKKLRIAFGALALALVFISGSSWAQPAPVPVAGVTGRVVETMDAATYTYVLVDDGTRQVWAAGPKTAVAVGDRVALPPGMVMRNFASKSLGRTFDEIYFVGALRVVKGEAAQPLDAPLRAHGGAEAPAGAAAGAPHGAAAAPPAVDLAGIAKAEGGQTVAEILAGKAENAGKPVAVRARVVKFTPAVMGRNWLHVQDGSGAAGDLTVTTSASAKVGDTVLVRGTLATDRDFGSGYRYDVIVEDAAVTVE